MAERIIGPGAIDGAWPKRSWVLVLGGVSREGNRRARRAIRNAADANLSVIWFDGFSERFDDDPSQRVPLDAPVRDGSVLVVDYAAEERAFWLNRMVQDVPDALLAPIVRAEDALTPEKQRRTTVLTRVRRWFEKVLAAVGKKVLRRLSLIFRPRVGWRLLRDDIRHIHRLGHPPRQIIYGDDSAVTLGWHSARLWPETPTSMEFQEK